MVPLGVEICLGETTVGWVNTPLPRSVVVVGAGLAGLRTVGELRAQGFTGRITLVGAEVEPPYDRPPLSKELFGSVNPLWLSEDLGIDLDLADQVLTGTSVTGLKVQLGSLGPEHHVTLSDGRELIADAVVLATGSVPNRRPEWSQGPGGVRTLHSLADSQQLRAALQPGSHLVCIGAGWIGAEVSGLAAQAGCTVTVVEAGATPLLTGLGARAGALTAGWYQEAGVDLRTNTLVVAADATSVTLASGEVLAADVVLAAVGARPATDWLGGTLGGYVDLLADGAIDVDAQMRPVDSAGAVVPELSRVRVVGDCASRRSVRHGRVPGGHWDAALRGPAAAVASLLAASDPLGAAPAADPAPYVFSTQFGRELVLYGQVGPHDDVVLRGDPAAPAGAPGWAALFFAPQAQTAESGTSAPDASTGSGSVAGTSTPGSNATGRTLTAVLTVDRPRDVAGARKLFAADRLPRLDPVAMADPTVKLRQVTA